MSHAKTLLKLSAVAAAILSGHAAWAQTTCNGATSPPCLNPNASDSGGNTAGGTNALPNAVPASDRSTGVRNTAFGDAALQSDSYGRDNTAFGNAALQSTGTGPLKSNCDISSCGSFNSAFGGGALYSNTNGLGNAAFAGGALLFNTSGDYNAAFGPQALQSNTTGDGNDAFGSETAFANTIGNYNTAFGHGALLKNTVGSYNTILGGFALTQLAGNNSSSNIAVGYAAGDNLTAGSNNVYIASPGGAASESGTIRIGTADVQTAVYVAGINNARPDHGRLAAVVVDSDGQLGVRYSSARYKQDIADMGEQSSRLFDLRPVTYRYKTNLAEPQYGLIAEEVDKVYPDLVIRGKDGQIEYLDYDALVPMLLNEVQKQQKELAALKAQSDEVEMLKAALAEQSQRLAQVEAQARAAASLVSR